MKTYNLEFQFFCASIWKRKYLQITALSKIQLIRAFVTETEYIFDYQKKEKQLRKECWNECKLRIIEKELQFPIIKRLYYINTNETKN